MSLSQTTTLQSLRVAQNQQAALYVQSISDQILLSKECCWGELLSAAPSALVTLGQAFIAASSASTNAVLRVEKSGRLESTSLRANLQHCADIGQEAFMDAESTMNRISISARHICSGGGTVDKILIACSNDTLAKMDLQVQIDRLQKFSVACVKDSASTQQKFKEWADFAQELKRACVLQDDETKTYSQELENEHADKQSSLAFAQDNIKRTKDQVQEAKNQAQIFEQDMKNSQAKIPGGWALAGQQAFNGLMGIGSSMLTGTKNVLSNTKIIADTAGMRVQISASDGQPKMLVSSGEVSIHDRTDYQGIYTQTQPLLIPLKHLRKALQDACETNNDATDIMCGEPAHRLYVGLCKVFNNLSDNKAMNEYARQYNDILHRTYEHAKSVQHKCDSINSYHLTSQRIDIEKRTCEKWLDETNTLCEECETFMLSLDGKQKEAERKREEEKVAKRDRKSGKSRSLKILRENYTSAQEALGRSHEKLQEVMAREQQDRMKFNEIQLELQRLSQKDITIKDTLKILARCISNLTDFQNNLTTFRSFFQHLNDMITGINDGPVQEFLGSARQFAAAKQIKDVEESKLMMQRFLERVKLEALQVRGSYEVAGEIASTYTLVSRKHIMPGVYKVNQFMIEGAGGHSDIATKIESINSYARRAQSQISRLAKERQDKLKERLYDSERQIEEQRNLLIEDAGGASAFESSGAKGYDTEDEDDEDDSEWSSLPTTGTAEKFADNFAKSVMITDD